MNRQGYVRLHRKMIDSRVFANAELYKTFTWCVMKASNERAFVKFKKGKGFIDVEIKPGQFVFGRLSASNELKTGLSNVRNRMARLEKMGCIKVFPKRGYSIVYVAKWNIYQAGAPEDSIKIDGETYVRKVSWIPKP